MSGRSDHRDRGRGLRELASDWVAGSIGDVGRIRAILVEAARARKTVSYSELLNLLGHRFTRPKMRALCKTLDVIDRSARDVDEPELAVLVVRESDGLPGQGWWAGGRPYASGYDGPWVGPRASAFVKELQQRAFAYWALVDNSRRTLA